MASKHVNEVTAGDGEPCGGREVEGDLLPAHDVPFVAAAAGQFCDGPDIVAQDDGRLGSSAPERAASGDEVVQVSVDLLVGHESVGEVEQPGQGNEPRAAIAGRGQERVVVGGVPQRALAQIVACAEQDVRLEQGAGRHPFAIGSFAFGPGHEVAAPPVWCSVADRPKDGHSRRGLV